MKYSELGNTGLKVSRICLGTMTFGEQNTEAEGHEQLDYALSQGINFIDTAEIYSVPGNAKTQGSTERIIGTWLKKRNNRQDVILGSKIGGPSPRFDYIRPNMNFSPAQIQEALENSLKRLQTDYLDLYQLHWPERRTNFFGVRGYTHPENEKWKDNFQEILEALQGHMKAGKIRHIGISNETAWGFSRYLHLSESLGLPRVVSIQNPYSLLNRLFEINMSEMSIREHVGLLAYSPMAFGMLSGKYHSGNPPVNGRIKRYPTMSRYNSSNSMAATEAYIKIAQEAGMSPATLSLAFVNSRRFLTSNIIGATNLDQLKENIASIDVELSEDTLRAINEVHERIPNPAP